MEEINNKAYDDELNKAHEEIHESPRTKIPVPKADNNKQSKDKKEKKNYG